MNRQQKRRIMRDIANPMKYFAQGEESRRRRISAAYAIQEGELTPKQVKKLKKDLGDWEFQKFSSRVGVILNEDGSMYLNIPDPIPLDIEE